MGREERQEADREDPLRRERRASSRASWASGPAYAIPLALERAGLQLKDMDIIEINEAFASQVLGCLKLMNVDFKDPRVNPNGGAIAIGHPLGASGARLALTVARELQQSGGTLRRGVAVHRRRPGPRRDPGKGRSDERAAEEGEGQVRPGTTRCCSSSSSRRTSAWCATRRAPTARTSSPRACWKRSATKRPIRPSSARWASSACSARRIPPEYGGPGLNYVSYGLIAREVERVDSGLPLDDERAVLAGDAADLRVRQRSARRRSTCPSSPAANGSAASA